MASEYAPGTVAVATVRGVEGVRVFLADPESDLEWTSGGLVEDNLWHTDVKDVRPLVVLDLGDNTPEIVANVLRKGAYFSLADQIEAQTKPPRIPEPGLWGVVAADGQGLDDVHWVRQPNGWTAVVYGRHADWEQLIDPVLVRGGVDA